MAPIAKLVHYMDLGYLFISWDLTGVLSDGKFVGHHYLNGPNSTITKDMQANEVQWRQTSPLVFTVQNTDVYYITDKTYEPIPGNPGSSGYWEK